MRPTPAVLAAACALLIAGPGVAGENHATAAEAESMVKAAVAFIRANGPEEGYAEIQDPHGRFVDRDLYVVVYSVDGKCLAHGANKKMVGMDLSNVQDVDGKYYVRQRMELAETKASFWHDYKFANPTTKKIEPKRTYCERVDATVVCGGIYKL